MGEKSEDFNKGKQGLAIISYNIIGLDFEC